MLGHHQSEVHTGDSTLLTSGPFLLEKKLEYVVLCDKSTHLSGFLLALPSSISPRTASHAHDKSISQPLHVPSCSPRYPAAAQTHSPGCPLGPAFHTFHQPPHPCPQTTSMHTSSCF